MGSHRPARPPAAVAPPELLFCAVCHVSIAVAELESGVARRTPRGRIFCGICATATPAERERRRADLELEFADDAPVPVPAEVPTPLVVSRARDLSAPPPLAVLDARVGELERALFRIQTRLAELEERLRNAMRKDV
jgi:hypothetical protein